MMQAEVGEASEARHLVSGWMIGSALIICLALSASPARAETYGGRVVGVSDGDTLTLLVDRVPIKIRVEGIDAPEKAQPFGAKAKAAMSDCAYGRQANVEWKKFDRYGRTIGKVVVDGIDCGLGQIRQGLAWHYKQYEREQSPSDRTEYAAAELAARKARLGLWADENPLPPWTWRRARKSALR